MSLPTLLPSTVLTCALNLPLKPLPFTLSGEYITIRPFDIEHDTERMYRASNGSEFEGMPAFDAEATIWRWMMDDPPESLEQFRSLIRLSIDNPEGLCLCVLDVQENRRIGVVNILANRPQHLTVELGGIWYIPAYQGTPANSEATFLLLEYLFGLGYRRVEWKCNALNERSRKAAERLGFEFEGTFRNHMIVKGRSRDTAWYSITDSNWHLSTKDKQRQSLDAFIIAHRQ